MPLSLSFWIINLLPYWLISPIGTKIKNSATLCKNTFHNRICIVLSSSGTLPLQNSSPPNSTAVQQYQHHLETRDPEKLRNRQWDPQIQSIVIDELHLLLASRSPARSLVLGAFFHEYASRSESRVDRLRTPRHADCPRKGDVIKIIIFQRPGLTSVSFADYTAACNAISIILSSLFSTAQFAPSMSDWIELLKVASLNWLIISG